LSFHRYQLLGKCKAAPVQQIAPNLARPGVPFAGPRALIDAGVGMAPPYVSNYCEVGRGYRTPTSTAIVNPAGTKKTDNQTFERVLGNGNTILSGVSRDATGAALGSVRVLIFRTEDNSFVGETLSSVSNGSWSILLNKGGPFFVVEYKAGSPDIAGTSVNTLLPVPG
jgi:hypothetical protein